MQRREGINGTILIFIFIFLCNQVYGQVGDVLDSIPIYKVYEIPMPNKISWGHDEFAGRNYLKSSKIESGYWIQNYLLDSTRIARVFRIENESLHGRDIYFNAEGDIRAILCYNKGFMIWKVNFKNRCRVDSTRFGGNGMELYVKWYENGEMSFLGEANYAEHYYADGNLKLRVNFENGVLHGRSVYVDLSGNKYHINWIEGVPSEQYILSVDGKKNDFRFRKLAKDIRKLHFANLFN